MDRTVQCKLLSELTWSKTVNCKTRMKLPYSNVSKYIFTLSHKRFNEEPQCSILEIKESFPSKWFNTIVYRN